MDESTRWGDSTPTASIPWDSSWPRFADEGERHLLFSHLEERFGIPEEIFADFLVFRRRKSWWLFPKPVGVTLPVRFKVFQVGLKIFDNVGKYLKPSTRMIQLFGCHATKGVIHLTDDEFERLLRCECLEVSAPVEDGFVILRLREHVLGVGLLLKGNVTSRIRQSVANQIVTTLDSSSF